MTRRERHSTLLALTVVPTLLFAAAVILYVQLPLDTVIEFFYIYSRFAFLVWCMFAGIAIVAVLAKLMLARGEKRPPLEQLKSLMILRWREDYGLSILWPPILIAILFASFGLYKQLVLPNAGFGMDAVLDRLDAITFFGSRPWRITHLLPAPWTTFVIDRAYASWFLPTIATIIGCSFISDRRQLRTQYLLAFTWTWLFTGGLLAFVFGSAGPCFGGVLPGDNTRYADLMAVLQADQAALAPHMTHYHLISLSAQKYLVDLYLTHTIGVGGGVSSAPSMHVAIATLVFLAARRVGRVVGWIGATYAVLIFVGSIHLGWHYAWDGLISVASTLAVWAGCGWVIERITPLGTPKSGPRPFDWMAKLGLIGRRRAGAGEA